MKDRGMQRGRGTSRRGWTAALVLATLGPLAGAAGASTFRAMSQGDVVKRSQAVVVGTVLKVESFWNEEHTMILTDALLQVEETVAGRADSTVVRVQTFGGQVDGYIIDADGFPTFVAGERMLLFLGPEAKGAHRVTGYLLGQYRIRRDAAGAEVAMPTLDRGVRLLDAAGRPAAPPRALPLEDLKHQIRQTARALNPRQ